MCHEEDVRTSPRGSSKTNDITFPAIYIIGPSSVGKTTVCNALAERYNLQTPAFITEVARTVMKERGFTRNDVGKIDMQEAILIAQLDADEKARRAVSNKEARILLSDRSAIDPIVYAYLTSRFWERRSQKLIKSKRFQDVLERLRKSIFVLLCPVPEWLEDDGVRSIDESNRTIDAFRKILKRLKIPYHEVDASCKPLEDRITRIEEFIRNWNRM